MGKRVASSGAAQRPACVHGREETKEVHVEFTGHQSKHASYDRSDAVIGVQGTEVICCSCRGSNSEIWDSAVPSVMSVARGSIMASPRSMPRARSTQYAARLASALRR